MLTVGDARPFVAPWVQGGVCEDDPRVLAAINEAEEVLINKQISRGVFWQMQMCIYDGCVVLPREVDRIVRYRLDGYEGRTWSKFYEFLSSGPGELSRYNGPYRDLVDRGETPVQYKMFDYAHRVMVFSDHEEDDDSYITIRGYDETNREVFSEDGTVGERVQITNNKGIYTQHIFSQITSIVKPTTNGYVYLHAYKPDEGYIYFLSAYHPDETRPSYRQYAIVAPTATCCNEDTGETVRRGYLMTALVKLRFVPLVHDTDVLRIQHLTALKSMIQAVTFYDSSQVQAAIAYEARAEKLLVEQNASYQSDETTIDFDSTISFGGLEQV